jgi:hypothetical protein
MTNKPSPSPYARKAIIKEEVKYTIYGILYDDDIRRRSVAVAAAKTDEEAIGMLEKALVEGMGYEHMRGQLNADTIDTGFKASKEGLIFAFDRCSNSIL